MSKINIERFLDKVTAGNHVEVTLKSGDRFRGIVEEIAFDGKQESMLLKGSNTVLSFNMLRRECIDFVITNETTKTERIVE